MQTSMSSIGQTLRGFIPIFTNLRSDRDDSPDISRERRGNGSLDFRDAERVA